MNLLTMIPFLATDTANGDKIKENIYNFFNGTIVPIIIAIITITFIVCGVLVLFKYLTASDERAQAEAKKYTKMFLIGIVVALFILVLAAIVPGIIQQSITNNENLTNTNS